MIMRGRPMEGWPRVGAEHVQTEHSLAGWVKRRTTYAKRLPAK
jgi:hypothetical protein